MNPHHLLFLPKSGNTYYFRGYIPTDLIEHFGGVKEFRISLKCAIKSRSIRTSKILDKKVSQIFDEIRQGMKSLDIDDIKEILRIEIRKQILHTHHMFEGTNRWSKSGVENSLKSVRLKESNLKETLESDLTTYQGEVNSKLEGILKSLDIEVDRDSINFKKLRNKFIDLYLLRYDWMNELLNESGKTDADFRLNAQQKLGIVLFPELTNSSGMDKKNAFARNTHLQPDEPTDLELHEKLQQSESILESRILQNDLVETPTSKVGSLSTLLRTFVGLITRKFFGRKNKLKYLFGQID